MAGWLGVGNCDWVEYHVIWDIVLQRTCTGTIKPGLTGPIQQT